MKKKYLKKLIAATMALAIASTSTAVTTFAGNTDNNIPAVNIVAEGEEQEPHVLTRVLGPLDITIDLEKNEVIIKDSESEITTHFKNNAIFYDGTIIETVERKSENEATEEDLIFMLTMMAVLMENPFDTIVFSDNVVEVRDSILDGESTMEELSVKFGKNIESIYPNLIESIDVKITIYGYKGTAAETYAAENNYPFIALDDTAAADDLGDVSGDNKVDSSDASLILEEYANIQTGAALAFNDTQKKSADVNKDSKIDSADASKILEYYAAVSTGQTPSWD